MLDGKKRSVEEVDENVPAQESPVKKSNVETQAEKPPCVETKNEKMKPSH